jgi:hypothetical protein
LSEKLRQPIEQAPRRRPTCVHEKVEASDKLFATVRAGENPTVVGQIDADAPSASSLTPSHPKNAQTISKIQAIEANFIML